MFVLNALAVPKTKEFASTYYCKRLATIQRLSPGDDISWLHEISLHLNENSCIPIDMLEQHLPLIPDPKSLLLAMAQQRSVEDVLTLVVAELASSEAVALARIWLIHRARLRDVPDAVAVPRPNELSSSGRERRNFRCRSSRCVTPH